MQKLDQNVWARTHLRSRHAAKFHGHEGAPADLMLWSGAACLMYKRDSPPNSATWRSVTDCGVGAFGCSAEGHQLVEARPTSKPFGTSWKREAREKQRSGFQAMHHAKSMRPFQAQNFPQPRRTHPASTFRTHVKTVPKLSNRLT